MPTGRPDPLSIATGESRYSGINPPAAELTFALADTGTVGAPASGSITNTSAVASAPWAIAPLLNSTMAPNSGGSIAPGAVVSLTFTATVEDTYTPVLVCSGATITGASQTVVVGPAPAVALSATSGGSPTVGVPFNLSALLSNPLTLPLVGTPENMTGSASFSPATVAWSSGDLNKTFTATWLTTGAVSVRVTAPGGIVSNTLPLTVGVGAATSLTLSVSQSTGTSGVTTITVTATPNGPAPSTGTATIAVTGDSGYTLGATTLNFTLGSSAAQSTTFTRTTNGSNSIALTNNMGLTVLGSPQTYTSTSVTSTGDFPGTTTLTPSVTGTLPFSIGQVFKQGSLASSDRLAGLQLDPLTYWTDGSIKHGIVSGTAVMTSGSAYSLAMSIGAEASGPAITTADLAAAIPAGAQFTAGALGSASFGATEWASPARVVCTGPRMSSWLYRKQIGSDPHLVAWLEIRMWSPGFIEVFPWIENGYLQVAGPTNKSATYTFTLGGTLRFSAAIDIKHHTRIPLVSATEGSVRTFSHWLGTDPGVVPAHDGAYLMATKLVPNMAWGAPSSTVLDATQQTYTPNTLAGDGNATGTGGGAGSIISAPSARYLTSSGDLRAWKAMMAHALSAGSWSWHYRDSGTQQPVLYSSYATAQIGDATIPDGTGGTNHASGPAMTHMPSYAYLPFLVTGRWWFLEEMQFQTTWGFLSVTPAYRNNGNFTIGTRSGFNSRGGAWSMNLAAQAASATPTSHALSAQFVATWERTTAHLYGTYVSGTLEGGTWVSPQGILGTHNSTGNSDDGYVPINASSAWWDAGFMHNYLVAVLGYTSDLGLPQSATSLSNHVATRDHAYKSIIGRADDGLNGRYNWRRFTVFSYPIGTDDVGLPVSTYYTAAQSYADLVTAWACDPALSAAYGLSLKRHPDRDGGGAPIGDQDITSGDSSRAYGSTALAALSMAAEHDVPGANLAHYRVSGASNYVSAFSSYLTDDAPNWAVKPRLPNGLPAVNTVVDWTTNTIDAAAGAGRNYWRAWGGVVYAQSYGRFGSMISGGPGHGDGGPSDLSRTNVETRLNTMVKPPAPIFINPNNGSAGDGYNSPGSGYTGNGTGFMWATTTPGNYTVQTGELTGTHWQALSCWLPENAFPGVSAPGGYAFRPVSLGFYEHGQVGTFTAHRLKLGIDTLWTINGTTYNNKLLNSDASWHAGFAAEYDPMRGRCWYHINSSDSGGVLGLKLGYRTISTGAAADVLFSGSVAGFHGGYNVLQYSSRHDLLIDLCNVSDVSDVYDYTKIIVWDPATNQVYRPTQTGTVPTTLGKYTARSWSDVLNCAIFYPGEGSNTIYFCKPSGNPRNASWAWSSLTVSGTMRSGTINQANNNRLRHIPALGNILWWGAATNQVSQLIHITPP